MRQVFGYLCASRSEEVNNRVGWAKLHCQCCCFNDPVPVGQVFWTTRTGYYPACRGGVPKADLGNQRRISLKQQH